MKTTLQLFGILVGLLHIFQTTAHAMPLRVVTDELPPYSFVENDRLTGISTDIVRALLEHANLEAEFEVYPKSRAFAVAKTTPNTLIFSLKRTQKREDLFHWIGAIIPSKTCLYSLKSRDDIFITEIDEAKIYKVITQLNGNAFSKLREKDFNRYTIYQSHSIYKAYEMLLHGRGDLLAYPILSVQHALKKRGEIFEDKLKQDICFAKQDPLYLALNINSDAQLVTRLKTALKKLKKGRTYNDILIKYDYPLEDCSS